jgi:hypothetical protein
MKIPILRIFIRISWKSWIPVSLVLVCLFSVAAPCRDDEGVMPRVIGDWSADGDQLVFAGEELFDYIDGGAEIYFEYGFEKVTVQDYTRGEDLITAEVYRMKGDAFGIFTLLKSENDEFLEIGNEGAQSDYYLLVWCGSRLVAVTAQSEFEGRREAVRLIAAGVTENLAADGKRAELMDILPEQNRVASSEKYIVGPIGLQNVAPLAARIFSGYAEIASAHYGSEGDQPSPLLVMRYPDAGASDAALGKAQAKAGEISGLEAVFERNSLRVSRSGRLELAAVAVGRYVIVTTRGISGQMDSFKNYLQERAKP